MQETEHFSQGGSSILEHVGKLIVSKYVAESINNWLLGILAMKNFVSCIQISNQLLIDSATYLLTINSPTLKSVAISLYDIKIRTLPQKPCMGPMDS